MSARPGWCVPTLFGASERDDGSSMAAKKRPVTGGVDTHGKTHHAAAVDQTGRVLGDQEFPATAAGYRALLAWLRSFGTVVKVGVEGTGTYGAGLARYLAGERDRGGRGRPARPQDPPGQGQVRPDRRDRRRPGRPVRAGRAACRRPAPARSRRSARCGWPAAARSRPAPPRSTSSTA